MRVGAPALALAVAAARLCLLVLATLAALPALAGDGMWLVAGEVVSASLTEQGAGGVELAAAAAAWAGPAFAPRQHTAVLAASGQAATLQCTVLRLGDKSVSWVRSRDLQILSHAGVVFTMDARVSAEPAEPAELAEVVASADTHGAASSHALRIHRLEARDSGRYECQVNTDPKLSLFFNLTVLDEPMPTVVVSALNSHVVRGVTHGASTLSCEARYSPAPRALPLPALAVTWRRRGQPGHLSLQSTRGGVSLDTERWAPARVVSRLTLAELRAADAGQYECAARAPTGQDVTDTVTLLLDDDEEQEQIEAMQRDQSALSGAPAGADALPLAATTRALALAAVVLAAR